MQPIRIKDQGQSDMCGAYASCAVSEPQEETELNPEFQFAMTKKIEGNKESWGANLRDVCKSFVKYGSLPQTSAKVNLQEDGRDKCADFSIYTDKDLLEARKFAKNSFFSVDIGWDTFDSIRGAIWANRHDKCNVLTGCLWRAGWENDTGIIPTEFSQGYFGHAFCIIGWSTLGTETYLLAQLSNGTSVGKGGIFYFPREVVNRDFTYGMFMFKDISPSDVLYRQQYGILGGDNWLVQMWKILKTSIMNLWCNI